MASQQSEVFICNLALGWLGEKPIISLNDPSTPAQLCKTNYPSARDICLEEGEWSFARRIFQLPVATGVPPDEDPRPPYEGQLFLMPGEMLRPIRCDDGSGSWRLEWEPIGKFIVTQWDEVLYVDAMRRLVDTTRFTPAFVQATAARLAADIAMPITESSRKEAQMEARYESKMGQAKVNDGRAGTRQRMRSDRLRRARR